MVEHVCKDSNTGTTVNAGLCDLQVDDDDDDDAEDEDENDLDGDDHDDGDY